MKKLSPLALAMALAFPVAAHAQSNSDMQKQIDMLKAQIAELKQMVKQQAAVPAVAVTDDKLRAEVASMRVKMDAMEEAKTTSGFDGLKFSGSIDPTYIYSQRAGRGQFYFLNPVDGTINDLSTDAWGYQSSNLGGVNLKFEKSFENGMMATIKLRPYKGTNTTWVEEAFMTLPLGNGMNAIVGKQNSWNGYEAVDSQDTKTVTHNLLWDFGGPLQMTGAGLTFKALGMDWKTIAGNMNSDTDLPNKANHNRGFHWRGDMAVNEYFGWGVSGMHGTLGGNRYNYADADFWYTRGDLTLNGQLEGSATNNGANNGGDAGTVGASVLAAYKLGDGWETVVRADWLDDHKNGGTAARAQPTGCPDDGDLALAGVYGTAALSCGDYRNGFGLGAKLGDPMGYGQDVWYLGNPNRGAKRSALTLGLNYQFHENALLKLEVRYDWSDLNSFYDYKNQSYAKSNTTFGAQTVIKF